jgi:hypothetical protein
MVLNLDELSSWLKSRTIREQWSIFALGIILIYEFWNMIIERPVINQSKDISQNISKLTQENSDLETQLMATNQLMKSDAVIKVIEKRKAIDQKYNELQKLSYFVKFKDLAKIVHDIYHLNKNIQINNYTVMESTPWEPAGLEKKNLFNNVIYKYPMQLVFRGDYFNTLEFFKQLETTPWNFYLDSFSYKVEKYPMAEINTQFYVLSQEKD